MIKAKINNFSPFLPFYLVGIYILLFFTGGAPGIYLWAAVVLLLVITSSLKSWTSKVLFKLYSSLVTFPVLFIFGFLPLMVAVNFTSSSSPITWFIVLFALLYALILRDLPKQIKKQSQIPLMVALVLLSSTLLYQNTVLSTCYTVSRAEKGMPVHQIEHCKRFGLYNVSLQGRSGKFAGTPKNIFRVFTIGPAFFGAMFFTLLLTPKKTNQPKI